MAAASAISRAPHSFPAGCAANTAMARMAYSVERENIDHPEGRDYVMLESVFCDPSHISGVQFCWDEVPLLCFRVHGILASPFYPQYRSLPSMNRKFFYDKFFIFTLFALLAWA